MTWKDISSLSQGDKIRTPYAWEFRAGGVRVGICNNHRDYPNNWVFTYYGIMDWSQHVPFEICPKDDVPRAQREAAQLLITTLNKVIQALEPEAARP